MYSLQISTSQRRYRRLQFPRLWLKEYLGGVHWNWLWVFPYSRNNWRRQLNMLSFCFHICLRLAPVALLGRLLGKSPSIILASSPQLPAAFTCLLIARLAGIPFVVEVRDLWPQVLIDQGGKSVHSPIVRLLSWMEHQVYRYASTVVVLAKGAETFVVQRGAKKTAWLPNGPDLELFSPRPLPVDRPFFTVLYAGAHGEANALENVICAARLLEMSQHRVRIRLVGDGPEKQSLILLAQGLTSVTFQAPVPKDQIPGLMAEADAILLSLKDVSLFRYGVSPNKLYDAYALGRPVITTVAGAINEEVEEHQLGVTAPPGDPQALADAIIRLMNTPNDERQAMANRAIELAHSTYSRQRINSEYNTLLHGLITK